MKILFVLGTRPEAIKLAPVIRKLAGEADFDCKLCVSGQHQDLLAPILKLFELRADWNLGVMRPDQDLAYLTGAVLTGIGKVLDAWRPDRVVVQGDTTTTLAAGLAALYRRVPVAHVEAGLRTDDIYAPWPEEANRRLVARLVDLHFAPTPRARGNLLREGIGEAAIVTTGNTGIDALLWVADRLDQDSAMRDRAAALVSPPPAGRRLVLMTGHRRESFDGGLSRVCRAMAQIARRPDVAIVFPVHPNPHVRRAVAPLRNRDNVLLLEPVEYCTLVYLLRKCHFVVTDSGGIQEEAPSFGKPVLVTREVTERVEAIEIGAARLVGTDGDRLLREMTALLDDPQAYARMSLDGFNPYGDGRASERIAARLAAG